MISYPHEVKNFKEYFKRFTNSQQLDIQFGTMVETPSSALLIEQIYKHADFARIGPGDLSQFTLTTLRENIDPGDFSGNILNPAVIKLIRMVVKTSIKLKKR